MFSRKISRCFTFESKIMPRYFIYESIYSKYIIKDPSEQMIDVPITMYIKSSILSQKIMKHSNTMIQHIHVTRSAATPRISICLLFNNGLFFECLLSRLTDRDHKRKICPCSKRRIDIDQIDLPGELLQKRTHHQQVIAPDELVPPSIFKGVTLATLVNVKQRCLHAALLRFARGTTLVDGLDDLERQVDPRNFLERAVLVVLAGPDQLGLRDVDLRHYRVSPICFRYSLPAGVRRNRCLLLRGLSGMVISIRPA